MNSVTVSGAVREAPQVRFSPDKRASTAFRLIIDDSAASIWVVCSNDVAEYAALLHPGERVCVLGMIAQHAKGPEKPPVVWAEYLYTIIGER